MSVQKYECFVRAEVGLDLRDGDGRRAGEGRIVRKVLGKPPLDLGKSAVDC